MSTPLLAAALLAALTVGLALLPGGRTDARATPRSGTSPGSPNRCHPAAPAGPAAIVGPVPMGARPDRGPLTSSTWGRPEDLDPMHGPG